jgi:hypothetical protein
MSIEIKLLLIHMNLVSNDFPFEPQRNLLIRKVSIEINLPSIHLNLRSMGFRLTLKEIYW